MTDFDQVQLFGRYLVRTVPLQAQVIEPTLIEGVIVTVEAAIKVLADGDALNVPVILPVV